MNQENNLALYLKRKRIGAGLSQRQVARKLGYTTAQFVSNWERGISEPPISALKTLAVLYELDADELFEVTLNHIVSKVTIKMRQQFFGKTKIKK